MLYFQLPFSVILLSSSLSLSFLIPVPSSSSSVPSRSFVCVCPLASLVPVFVRQGEVYFEWLSRLLCEDLGPEHWYA